MTLSFSAAFLMLTLAAIEPSDYFKITAVDEQSGRPVPLVELKTVNNLRFYTDSAGVVAFHEPGLMEKRIFFHVKSHGYEFPRDGFGYRGKALQVTPGGAAVLKLQRINIAERMYRVTGGGIYRDSLLLGESPPPEKPVINSLVLGSDSVVNAVFRNKIYWFWGDTNRPGYPLGNFHVPGAISELPSKGGLDPEQGINLKYFVDPHGFAKPTAKMPGEGPTWIDGLVNLKDSAGIERLFANYVKIKSPLTVYKRGLVEINPKTNLFEHRLEIPLEAPLHPQGHPLKDSPKVTEYVYFANPFPWIRVKATIEELQDLSKYQAYTCLKQGSREDSLNLDRDEKGRLNFSWKYDTPPLSQKFLEKLVQEKKMQPEEGHRHFIDFETGKKVAAHRGSVYWNHHRRRWVMVFTEVYGTSMLGEVWFAEADTLEGPWAYARKIVTHDRYSFYNPKQHPMFAKKDGKVIFFEGTYTHTFSGNPDQTPHYDYNQILYKLDLTDPRLNLPVAVYQQNTESKRTEKNLLVTGKYSAIDQRKEPMDWFVLERPAKKSVVVYGFHDFRRGWELAAHDELKNDSKLKPLFYALPRDLADPPQNTLPLFEFFHEKSRHRLYSTADSLDIPGYSRFDTPICLVWKNPVDAIPAK